MGAKGSVKGFAREEIASTVSDPSTEKEVLSPVAATLPPTAQVEIFWL